TEEGWGPTLTLATAHDTGELQAPPGQEPLFGEDIELPAELADAKAIAETWMREIARTAGIGWGEPEACASTRGNGGENCGKTAPTSAPPSLSESKNPRVHGGFHHGRYWARTSDLRLVEAALSQLS